MMAMGIFVVGVFVFSLVNVGLRFTGFVVFENSGSGFDDGVYDNIFYNGSGVVLAGANLSGSYVSEVFDAGGEAVWNNLSWVGSEPSVEFLYAVDGGGDVYKSSDYGINWILTKDGYGRGSATQGMFSDDIYLYIIVGGAREVWRSTDGENWAVVNNSFNRDLEEGEVDSNNKLYAIGGDGTVWQSTDFGVSWNVKGDFNDGATNDAKGSCIDSNDNFYITDGSKGVFVSSNEGVTWTEQVDDYGDGAGSDIACLGTDLYIIKDKHVWESTDSGISWTEMNDDAFDNNGLRMDSFDGILYVLDTKGKFYNSSDGVTWTQIGDMNPGDNNPKGLTSFVQSTSLSYYVRSCDDVCSGESWVELVQDLSVGDNRYFQYMVNFTSPDSSVSPVLESVSIDYDLVNTAPLVNIVSPQEGATYGSNESLDLEYNVFDDGESLTCWYNVDGGVNVSLVGCENGTFDVGGDGNYVLNVYVNDSLGLEASDSVSFSVAVGAPTISLGSPVGGGYLNSGENIRFSYTPIDIDLESCELWGDFDGGFGLNQINVSPTNGVVNSFYLNLSDGDYFWNVRCNDSVGNFAFDGNRSFHVDSVSPNVSLSQPVGKKTSRTVFSSWVVSDASPVSCKYNVYRGESVEVANSSVNCSNGSVNFEVTVDADFVFNFYVSDSAGNSNFMNLSFSVDSSVPVVVPSSGGGSGGGGGGYFVNSLARLQIDEINVIVSRGEEKSILVGVKNIGSTSVNKCRLVGGDFIVSNNVFNIGAGEIVDFSFVLRALDGVENLELKVKCLDNISGVVPLSVEVLKPSLDVSIEGIKFNSVGKLVIDYSVGVGEDYNGVLFFRILNSKGDIVTEISERVDLAVGEFYKGPVVFDLGDIEKDMLRISVFDGEVKLTEEDFIYSGRGVTGFASLGLSSDFFYIGIIFVVFLVLAGLLIRRIWKLKKGGKSKH